MSNRTDDLLEILRECLHIVESEIEVQPALLASCALEKMDPSKKSPTLISWAANLELRQLARGILRQHFDPVAVDNPQAEMFDGLQDRYPTKRNGEPTYVMLGELTESELNENISRLRKEASAKLQHADALEAYTLNRYDGAA